jgi:hypothetical protein
MAGANGCIRSPSAGAQRKLAARLPAFAGIRRGISLGSALAISGAAAHPNQGYHSSPLVAFLMTLFNVRLGWCSAIPGMLVPARGISEAPRTRRSRLFAEALGNTTDSYANVNLSDGCHLDNLGLYEMILRRCRHIVVIDAGCDSN